MADVYIVVFSLIGILVSLPALLVALNLLMPKTTGISYARLKQTPVKCFFAGIPTTAAFLLFIAIAANVPNGTVQALAFVAAFLGMGLGSLGGAGLARLLGERLGRLSQPSSAMSSWVRGAVVFELACLVPVVGWFLFMPIAGITLLGAATFGLVGWLPQRNTMPIEGSTTA